MNETAVPIRLLVGLGNPGDKYLLTRHNAGFWFADAVATRYGGAWRHDARFSGDVAQVSIEGTDLRLLKPQTYMNRSGESVAACVRYFRLDPREILVAHDELDLPPGSVRLKSGGGHGGHNGLRDIHRLIGGDYWRLRIGIGHPGHKSEVVSYVLNRADREAEGAVLDALGRVLEEMPAIAVGRMQLAMHRLHSA